MVRSSLRSRLAALLAMSAPLLVQSGCEGARSLGEGETGSGTSGESGENCGDEGFDGTGPLEDSGEDDSLDPCFEKVTTATVLVPARWVPATACESDPDPLPASGCFNTVEGYGEGAGHYTCAQVPEPTPDTELQDCHTGDIPSSSWFLDALTLDGATCQFTYADYFDTCSETTAGRPFIVEGEARRAKLVPGSGWTEHQAAEVSDLDAADRAWIAAQWLEDARMEHASIPAFARFVMQLVALGAPPKLIADAQAAIGDELRHAQMCLAMATRYGAGAHEPRPLPLEDFTLETELLDVVREVFFEGCIGETSAAYLAAVAARSCEDPVARQCLERIAEDELRHAELAWAFVRWAREREPHLIDQFLRVWMAAPTRTRPVRLDDDGHPTHGRLGAATRDRLHREAIAHLVRPGVAALLELA